MNEGIVFDMMRFSTRDGPGIRTTVFLKGCPLHCAWCHNPESQNFAPELMLRPQFCIGCGACVNVCPQPRPATQAYDSTGSGNGGAPLLDTCTACGACVQVCYADARVLVGRSMGVDAVMAEILKDRMFYEHSGGGVTLSGGEALAQPDFTLALLQACRAQGIHTALDTSGFVPWRVLEQVRPFVDLFLYDVKAIDDAIHRRYTGISNRLILENLERLANSGARMIVRVPLIPGINDSPLALDALASFLTGLPALAGVEVLPYHESGVDKYRRLRLREYTLDGLHPPDAATLQAICAHLSARGLPISSGAQP